MRTEQKGLSLMQLSTGTTRVISCVIALLLFVEMTLSSSITMVYGVENGDGLKEHEDEQSVMSLTEEDVIETGKDYTIFEAEDGSNVIQIYPSPVRAEEENGDLVDLDPSLQPAEDGNTYRNTYGFVDVSLPTIPSEADPIKVKGNDSVFSFYPLFNDLGADNSDAGELQDNLDTEETAEESVPDEGDNLSEEIPETENEELKDDEPQAPEDNEYEPEETEEYEPEEAYEESGETEEPAGAEDSAELEEVIEEDVENLYHEKETKITGLRYSTPDPDVDLQYYATDSGVKEDIILKEVPSSNEFSFMICCPGSIPELKYRAIVLNDEKTGEETGAIQEPFMTDSSETDDSGYSEELEYDIEAVDTDKGMYKVTLTVSEDYLKDPERVYPVTIDPSYTAKTASAFQTVYVLSKNPTTNYYSSGIRKMCMGYGSYDGVSRTYIHFPALLGKIKNNYISKATLSLTEYENAAKGTKFGIYRVTGKWSNSKITYKKQPSYNSTAVASGSVKGTSNAKQTLTLTSLVQGWAKGTYASNGILLKANSEKSSTKNYTSFHNCNATTASKRPVLTVTYTVPSPTKPDKPTETRVNGSTYLYTRKTSAMTLSWKGANSNILAGTQWRLVRFKKGSVYSDAAVVQEYTDTGVNKASGSFVVPSSKITNLPDGKYGALIRGRDKLGNVGVGKTGFFVKDNKAPNKPVNIEITSERSGLGEGHENNAKVTVDADSGGDQYANTASPFASGVGSYTVSIYDADTDLLIDKKENISADKNGNCTATFEDVESSINIYAKVKCKDKAGNESAETTSAISRVYNAKLPEQTSFYCDRLLHKWMNRETLRTNVSWNIDYEGELGGITVSVVNADKTPVSDELTDVRLLEDEHYPKKINKYRIDRILDFASLADGEYVMRFYFYPRLREGDDPVKVKPVDVPFGIDSEAPIIEGDDENGNIRSESAGTGEDEITGLASFWIDTTDNLSGLGSCSVEIIGDGVRKNYRADENSQEIGNRPEVSNIDTTEFDDGDYTIRFTVKDKALNTIVTEHTYHFVNRAPTPKIVPLSAYVSEDGPFEFRYSYPSGDASVGKISKLQTAIVHAGVEPEDEDFADLDTEDPKVSGTASVGTDELNEGEYDLCIRSVDARGLRGKVRKARFIYDESAPRITLRRPADNGDQAIPVTGMVSLRGSIEDPALKRYEVSYAAGADPDEDDLITAVSSDVPEDCESMDGLLAVVDLTDNTVYPEGSTATIRITAEDKAGNQEIRTIQVRKVQTVVHPADFEIDKGSSQDLSITEEQQTFDLSHAGQTYTPYDAVWLIDGTEAEYGDEGLDFSDPNAYEDGSLHSIAVYDRLQNGEIAYGVPTSEYVLADPSKAPSSESSAVVVNGKISVPAGSNDAVFETEVDLNEDIAALSLEASETVPQGSSIKYYLRTDDEEYIEISKGRDYIHAGGHLTLKAVLSKGSASVSPAINSFNFIAKAFDTETAKVGMMEQFNPVSVTETPQLNYKVKVSWEMPEETDTEGLTYEIYRSTREDFSEECTELLQEGITDTTWYDSYTLIDKDVNANNHEGLRARARKIPNADFYYKVRAVKGYGTEKVRKSRGAEGSGVKLPAMNEYSKRLGIKDYWGYSELDVGAGSGYIEQSRGNFVYTESDAYVKGKAIDLSMDRTYNSMSTGMTALGYSWDYSFNPVLLDTYDSYGDNTGMLFKDGSGTIYTFLSIPNDGGVEKIVRKQDESTGEGSGDDEQVYSTEDEDEGSSDSSDKEVIERIETTYRSPYGVYIELKKKEVLDPDDADQDGDLDEVTDLKYEIRTMSGETYTFNRNSQIEKYEDSNNNEVIYSYDELGRLFEVENPNGKSKQERESTDARGQKRRCIIRFSYYDGADEDELARELIRTAELPNGQIIKYEYDSSKRLTASRLYGAGDGSEAALDRSPAIETAYSYSQYHLSGMLKSFTITDPNGNLSSIGFADDIMNEGRCSCAEYPNKDRIEYTFIKANGEDQLYDQTVETTYVNKGGLIAACEDIGDEIYRYNADGNIVYTRDIDGSEVFTEYSLGLETHSYGDIEVYNISDDGTIDRSTDIAHTYTEYEPIYASNTLASKIASTKGNVSREVDIAGNVTEYEYKAEGDANQENPTSIVTEASDENGGGADMHESFSYDKDGNLTEAIDEDTGESVRYEYYDNGEVRSEQFIGTDGEATETSAYSYDEAENTWTETVSDRGESDDAVSTWKYDDWDRLIEETDELGRVTEHTYDALDRETKTTYMLENGSSLSERSEYDHNGNIISETDRDGRTTVYTYDNMDRVVSKTISQNGESQVWNYEYTVEDVTCPFESGNISYPDASVTTVTTGSGPGTVQLSRTAYDHADRIIMSEEDGISTSYRYNKDGEAIEIYSIGVSTGNQEESEGMTVLANYDRFGNNTANIVNPGWNGTRYFIDSDTQVYRYKYDALGNVIRQLDSMDHVVKHSYDSNGRVTSTALGNTGASQKADVRVKYETASNGNDLITITNILGQKSVTETDTSGNTVRTADLGDGSAEAMEHAIETTYVYDKTGNLTQEKNANGTKTYTYDSMDNMTESVSVTDTGDDTVTETSTFEYDAFGMMTGRRDYSGTSEGTLLRTAQFRYDSQKRLRKYYQGETELSDENSSDWITYSYDLKDNLTEVRYPSFTSIDTVRYDYDNYNRVTMVRNRNKGSSQLHNVRSYGYRSDNRVAYVRDYSADSHYIQKHFSYDSLGRCTAIDVTDSTESRQIEKFRYTYDKCNNITSEEMMHSPEAAGDDDDSDPDPASHEHISSDGSYHVRRDYTYDDLSELTGVSEYSIEGDGADAEETLLHTMSYTFDKIGNRTSETVDGETSEYTYDALGFNQLVSVTVDGDVNGSKTRLYGYDRAGNLTSLTDNGTGKTTSYSYNVSGDLVEAVVTDRSGKSLVTTNTYDGTGTRIAKTVTAKDAGGNVTNRETFNYYVAGDDLLFTYTEAEDAAHHTHRNITSENIFGIDGKIILTVRANDKRYVYSADLRGSTTSVIDSADNSVQVYYYDIYGEPEAWTASESIYNEILYTGAIYDESTGLYYLSSRYYDASSGRFISMDSYRGEASDPLSLNLYAYCEGNPIKYIDIDGHIPTIIIGAAVGFVYGVTSEFVFQFFDNNISKTDILVSGLSGAASGALIGSGAGVFVSIVGDGLIGIGENVGSHYLKGEAINKEEAFASGLDSAITSIIFAGIGGFRSSNSTKIIRRQKNLIRGETKSQIKKAMKGVKKAIKKVFKRSKTTSKLKRKTAKKRIKIAVSIVKSSSKVGKGRRKTIRNALKRVVKPICSTVGQAQLVKLSQKAIKKIKKPIKTAWNRVKKWFGGH